jgi:hypothetical protein
MTREEIEYGYAAEEARELAYERAYAESLKRYQERLGASKVDPETQALADEAIRLMEDEQ